MRGAWMGFNCVFFQKVKIAEDTVTPLTESIPWCERKQSEERKCRHAVCEHPR